MAKDIQIKYINDEQQWEELYPVTKTRLVTDESGQTINKILEKKQNKNESYTALEIDQKIEDISTNLKEFDIPVSNVEPDDDSKFWFEII